MPADIKKKFFAYIGTYTGGKSLGIYIYKIDLSSGTCRLRDTVSQIENPSYLTVNYQENLLYAVSEISEYKGETTGLVAAFSINNETGQLEFLNQKRTKGSAPCYVSLDEQGEYLFVSNYAGGSISGFKIKEDGKIGDLLFFKKHRGSSINRDRQEGPHPHSILRGPENNYIFVPDLGLDKIVVYSLQHLARETKVTSRREITTSPGAGPRHIVFHPEQQYFYVINELDSSVSSFTYYNQLEEVKKIQKISTLPPSFTDKSTGADIHIHPSGRFLYASNRGHDSIAVFKINKHTGKLSLLDYVSTRGKTPRGFVLDPTGQFLLAANQNSDSINLFSIDQKDGTLTFLDWDISVPAPVCIRFITKR